MFKFNRAYGQRIVKQTCRGHPSMVLLESDVLYHIRVKKANVWKYCYTFVKFNFFYKLYYIKQHKEKKISVALLVVQVC